MPEDVTAQAVLRLPDGSSALDAEEAITAANVRERAVSAERAEAAAAKLEALGFTVQERGPVSLSFRGPKALFERTFQTRLERLESDVGSGAQAYYQARTSVRVPDDLAALVAEVVLSLPPTLFL